MNKRHFQLIQTTILEFQLMPHFEDICKVIETRLCYVFRNWSTHAVSTLVAMLEVSTLVETNHDEIRRQGV